MKDLSPVVTQALAITSDPAEKIVVVEQQQAALHGPAQFKLDDHFVGVISGNHHQWGTNLLAHCPARPATCHHPQSVHVSGIRTVADRTQGECQDDSVETHPRGLAHGGL